MIVQVERIPAPGETVIGDVTFIARLGQDMFAEQAVAWFLAKGPGTRKRTTLTTFDMIEIK